MKINNKVAKQLKKDFPIFRNNKNLIYLDNAATSQRPEIVIKSMDNFSRKENANIHRGVYTLSEKATKKYEDSRKIIAKFINADPKEIVFTKNTTESLNLLSYTISSLLKKGRNEIVLTEMEHHSNLIPWQQLAKRKRMKLKFIKVKSDFTLDIEDAKKKITNKTAILAMIHVSNVLGTINPLKELIKLGKEKGVLTVLDAAQSVPHIGVDVKHLECDFLAFSSHKMLGPTGIGVLYGKRELLEKIPPFLFGGGMIKEVSYGDAQWAEVPHKFEAGTQNIGGVIGFAEAVKYIQRIGVKNIEKWENELLGYALNKMKSIKEIEIYNPGKDKSIGIISFNLKNIPPHDLASLMDDYHIAVRAGHNCTMPLMKKLKISGVSRISFYFYNTLDDIDEFVDVLEKIREKFD